MLSRAHTRRRERALPAMATGVLRTSLVTVQPEAVFGRQPPARIKTTCGQNPPANALFQHDWLEDPPAPAGCVPGGAYMNAKYG